ncbi:MAG: S9 family peptidase [Calditrichaeota bacterium]|nr:S9 family peptidase [Calditrichota bacterium]
MLTKSSVRTAFAFLFLLIFSLSLFAAEDSNNIVATKWLILGPVKTPLPIFHDRKNFAGKKFGINNLLEFEHFDLSKIPPAEGKTITGYGKQKLRWTVRADSSLQIVPLNQKMPQKAFAAAYLTANRWLEIKLTVENPHLQIIYFDGKEIGRRNKANANEKTLAQTKATIKVEPGKHLLLIKTVFDPKCNAPWEISASASFPKNFAASDLSWSTEPTHFMNIRNLLDEPEISNLSLSPDGKLVAMTLRKSLPPGDKYESWLEIRRYSDGKLLRSFRGMARISQFQWAPLKNRYSYLTSNARGRTLWISDLQTGEKIALLKKIQNFKSYRWAPDGSFLIYSVTEKYPAPKTKLKKLEGMPDRLPGWRDRDFLYRVNFPDGAKMRLTSGLESTNLNDISPDGKKILFTISKADFSERPYEKSTLYSLNPETLAIDSIWTEKWQGSVQWSPDGKKLLVTGGPSMFEKIGTNLPDDVIPNDYDTQAYIYDLQTKKVDPITLNFAPTINRAFWQPIGNKIYFVATDRSDVSLFRYDVKRKTFKKIDTNTEVIGAIDFAEKKPVAVFTGSSANVPWKSYRVNLKTDKTDPLFDPAVKDFANVHFGEVKRWTFRNKFGDDIEGRVYFPPNFDANKKYPGIVYYYGGTTPVTRNFGGRYPMNLYAAHGYVVYVLQPSGAVGFGQKFSARHVNDWGKIVADEIIDGVKKFLPAHPFVDPHRVGCMGASYGGFMTMLLQTKTDMFAAAIAHAGISMIPSYWGEGYWGYLYSAVATANSFPWNRRDIYVDQSPLFHADKIKTPLLLLQGTVDTNVPPGESIQLYTALKLLGRPVELVQIQGQNHHIMAYGRRKLWTKTILAWFDRWLKDQPQWWEDLYPPHGGEE